MDYSSFYFIALIFATLFLYFLPFIPAWYEWKHKTDAEPFRVNFLDRTAVDYSIRLFKEYITANFSDVLQNEPPTDSFVQKTQNSYIIGNAKTLELDDKDASAQKTNKVVLILGKGVLPGHIHFENKVYASGSLYTGGNNRFSEIYSEKDILIAANSQVVKLVYAKGSIIVEDKVTLNCYTRAEEKIQFSGPAKFQYLHAAAIEFEPTESIPYIAAVDVIGANLPRKIEEKAYILPANSEVESHLLIKAPLDIGANCKVIGNIKSYQDVKIGADTAIVGSIFSEQSISIADNCFIQGPIVARGSIYIGNNCFIGSSDSKTSIIAYYIHISKGCYTTGQILAKSQGTYHG
jgi:predicted acyltransferase (DUF342 family)